MAHVVMTLIRAFVGLMFAFLGIVAAMVGFWFLARQNAQLLGSDGALLLFGLLIAAAFCGVAWKLLRNIGETPAAA